MVPWYHVKMVADLVAEKTCSRFWGKVVRIMSHMLQGRLCRCHVSNASDRWTSTTCYKNSKFELIRYYIILWRRTAFYMVNYVLPALLINIISLFVFMMPSESGEKITLAISAMLNMTVFLMAVMEQLPPTDTISILSCVHTTDN